MCQVKVGFFFVKLERGGERGGNYLPNALYHLSGADCRRITFLAFSPLFSNSLTSPSLYLHLAFSDFPFFLWLYPFHCHLSLSETFLSLRACVPPSLLFLPLQQ